MPNGRVIPPISSARLWSIDDDPYPVDGFTLALGKAKLSAPDDDRVWLAWPTWRPAPGVSTRPSEWLTRCERARPDDRAVWCARLDWAQAAGRPDEVVRAATHLPGASFTQARVLELRAWMAARSGDRTRRASGPGGAIALEPADAAAVERLADLAAQDGERERVAELRRRKAEIENARRRLPAIDQPVPSWRRLRPSLPARPTRSAGGSTPRPGGGSRPSAIPRSSKKPRPHGHGWPRPSRRPLGGGTLADCWGRFVRRQQARTRSPGS